MAFTRTVMGGGTSAGQAAAIIGGAKTGIVALGTTYADATQLAPVTVHAITTSSASTGVKLPAGAAGDLCIVYNASGQTMLAYPPTGAAINALTATTQGYSFATAKTVIFAYASGTQIATVLTA